MIQIRLQYKAHTSMEAHAIFSVLLPENIPQQVWTSELRMNRKDQQTSKMVSSGVVT